MKNKEIRELIQQIKALEKSLPALKDSLLEYDTTKDEIDLDEVSDYLDDVKSDALELLETVIYHARKQNIRITKRAEKASKYLAKSDLAATGNSETFTLLIHPVDYEENIS